MDDCMFLFVSVDTQEYIRRQLEEEQRHLEMLQEQLLREQAMLLVSTPPHPHPQQHPQLKLS